MRYMTMIKSVEGKFGMPPPGLMAAIGKLGEEAKKAGVLVDVGGLTGSAQGARIRLDGGKVTVLDGPFTEAKELIGGFAVYETKTKEEVIEWARRFMNLHKDLWPGFEAECEIRQMMDFTPGMP